MYWNNIRTYYKSIVCLLVLCTAINIPIFIFIDPIANWLTEIGDDIEDANEDTQKYSYLGYTSFIILALINIPLFFTLLHRHTQDTPNVMFTATRIYKFMYFVLTILVCVLNPAGIITTTNINLIPLMGIAIGLFILMKHLDMFAIQQVILLMAILCLGLCGENAISSFYHDTSKYTEVIIFVVIYILGYAWNLSTIPLSVRIASIATKILAVYSIIQENIRKISGILIAEIVIIIICFYVRNVTKSYYGGELIVHEPISLNKTSSYKIADTYQYQYTLSFWVNIDATSPGYSQSSGEYTNVMLYGDNLLVTYNAAKNKLRTIIKNTTDKVICDVQQYPLQSWNHIVITYTNGMFDMFMNGNLIKSGIIVPNASNHELIVGAENGVSGQLCNLLFYNNVISIEKIESLYTHFKTKNPPIL